MPDMLSFALFVILRFVFVIAAVWILMVAIRHAEKDAGPRSKTVLIATVLTIFLFLFVAFLVPLFLLDIISEWYDFERRVPPDRVFDGLFRLARLVCLAAGLLLALAAGLPPSRRAPRDRLH